MGDDEPLDLTGLSGQELVAVVGERPEGELRAAVHRMGTAAALDRIFGEMPERFQPAKAAGASGSIQFHIDDGGEVHPYVCEIYGGACRTERATLDEPRTTIRVGLIPFLRLITGHASGPVMLVGGQLKLEGDLMFATRFTGMFETPGA